MRRNRAYAWATLVLLAATIAFVLVTAARQFPRGLITVVLLAFALATAWAAAKRRGSSRWVFAAVAVVSLVAAVVAVLRGDVVIEGLVTIGLAVVVLASAQRALAVHVRLPPAAPPERPVVVWNPRSGGGKATINNLADEARVRGIEPLELTPGTDLYALVRGAVANGADGLAAAGGDGTQAIVASIAAEHDLPFACIPAGTRNHFALDLGVDRNDVVGALDAFVNGGERRVDLAQVNDRVFVNNVSLGLYAQAVQREGYRDAKLRTVLETVPDAFGPDNEKNEMRWVGPGGPAHAAGVVILVSNNQYRLGHVLGSGTRPRIDDGLLGIAVAGEVTVEGSEARQPRTRQWSTRTFEVDSDVDVPAGIDGEAAELTPPLQFTILPGVLRVRIAPQHPGASPSAAQPDSVLAGVRLIARTALASGGPTATMVQ